MPRKPQRRFNAYDPFAWLYANHWGDEFHSEALPALDRVLLHELPRRAWVLDLCCGDGRITKALIRRGFQVTGIDGSELMLAYARQKSPKAEFLLADARRFALPPRYDAAISTFDSLNHVMETEDLGKVFANVFAALKPGGSFIFDLNREEAYMDMWSRSLHCVQPKYVFVSRGSYDSAAKIAVCDITLFRLQYGEWNRSDFRLSQRCHMRDEVLRLLERSGFEAEVLDAGRDAGMKGDIAYGRDFYLARKAAQDDA